MKAIKFSALDYLLKPVKVHELQEAFERIKNRKINKTIEQYELLKHTMVQGKPLSRIVLSTLEGYYPVKPDDIIYCRADDSYTHFHLAGNKHHVVSKNLKEVEELLAAHQFCRIHKSYLININHIEKINKSDGVTVVMNNHEELPVSARKRDEFISFVRNM